MKAGFLVSAAALCVALAGCGSMPGSSASLAAASPAPASTGVVKVTPLGGFDGEFCALDRALIFEDPNGTRILYDPGTTVMGPSDPRLGKVDVVLMTHLHADHLGNAHTRALGAGACGKPDTSVSDLPNGNTTNIVLAKKAKIVTGSDMPAFFAAKLRANGGDPAQSVLARFGASVNVDGVKITTVTAMHSNGVPPEFIGGPLGDAMKAAGIFGDAGLATGYVLRFSNGLAVYLSGDTGVTADQERVVRGLYHARLAVMNIGDNYTTGPTEAAYVINDLVKPASVIVSHANEAATRGGQVIPGTKTDRFIHLAQVPVHVPLSGRTMAFDADGRCTQGC